MIIRSICFLGLLLSCSIVRSEVNSAAEQGESVVKFLTTLTQVFGHSELKFRYDTDIGPDGVKFYQAKAIQWAYETGAIDTADISQLVDEKAIIERRQKKLEVTILSQGPLQAAEVKTIRNEGPAKSKFYRTDGSRFFISSHEHRWDIINSDILPVATPLDVLTTIPNVFPSLPITRSMLQNEETSLSWLNAAMASKLVFSVDAHKVRFAGPLQPAPEDKMVREVVEVGFDPQLKHLTTIRQWRVMGDDVEKWRTYAPADHEFQEIQLSEYKEVLPGVSLPMKLSSTFSARLAPMLVNLPESARSRILKVTGLTDKAPRMSILKHTWHIESINIAASFSKKTFLPPSDDSVVVYDYLTGSFVE